MEDRYVLGEGIPKMHGFWSYVGLYELKKDECLHEIRLNYPEELEFNIKQKFRLVLERVK